MSIVTQSLDVSTQSMVFISGRSKGTWHGDIYRQMGGGRDSGKSVGRKWMWAGLQVAVWACIQTNMMRNEW